MTRRPTQARGPPPSVTILLHAANDVARRGLERVNCLTMPRSCELALARGVLRQRCILPQASCLRCFFKTSRLNTCPKLRVQMQR